VWCGVVLMCGSSLLDVNQEWEEVGEYEGTSTTRATKYSDFSCCLVCLSSRLIAKNLCLVALKG